MNYTTIESEEQYDLYCKKLRELAFQKSKNNEDEMESIELLMDKWEDEHYKIETTDPISLLIALLENHNISQTELGDILGLSENSISQILNYKKGLSEDIIQKLANRFKMSQEAFNRPYPLITDQN
jgi:HTH-type transcriptional regulator/antitoxin HigA